MNLKGLGNRLQQIREQSKKGQISGWGGTLIVGTIVLFIVGILLAFLFLFLAQTQTIVLNFSGGNTSAPAYTSVGQVITAMQVFPQWLQLIALAVVLVVVLSLILGIAVLAMYFTGRIGGGGQGGMMG